MKIRLERNPYESYAYDVFTDDGVTLGTFRREFKDPNYVFGPRIMTNFDAATLEAVTHKLKEINDAVSNQSQSD